MQHFKPPTLEEIKAARAEHARAWKVNRPLREQNKAIRRRNWERQTGGLDGPQEPWVEYDPVADWAVETYAREEAWKKWLKLREPGEWRALVLGVADLEVRQWLANVVWWDFFADRLTGERWTELDEWLDITADHLEDFESRGRRRELERALIRVGYSEWEANRRAWGGYQDEKRQGGVRRRVNGGHHNGRVGRRFQPGAGRGDIGEHAGGVGVYAVAGSGSGVGGGE